ncbi:MAG: helix-turn-helix domain-containing protein [Actinobacteria bacterium]|nr:helix-turn-helix domain-containing protein [Actinomycetota bacterium]
MSNTALPEWLTVQEYAGILRISPRTVTRWVSIDSRMRVRRVGPSGRLIRIHRSEIERQEIPAA